MSHEYIELDIDIAACIAHCLVLSKVSFSFIPVSGGYKFKVDKTDQSKLDDCVREGCGPEALEGFSA